MKFVKYVYYDLETTGLCTKTCKILQIGAICGEKSFETLVNPEEKLSDKIVALTGITQEDADNCNISLREAMGNLIQFLASISNGQPVQLVAYNGFAFDSRFLYHALQSTHLQSQFEAVCEGFCDPLVVLRDPQCGVDMSSWVRNKRGKVCLKMGSVYQSLLGCGFDAAHTALADSRALQKICQTLQLSLPVTKISKWCEYCSASTKKRRKPLPLVSVESPKSKKVKLV